MRGRMSRVLGILLVLCVGPQLLPQNNTCGWTTLSLGAGSGVRALKVWDDGSGPALYAGTIFQQPGMQGAHGVKWDGNAWTPMGSGLNHFIFCFAVFDDGTGPALYAGGAFTRFGGIPNGAPYGSGVPVYGVARWDGSSWAPVGNGLSRPSPFLPGPASGQVTWLGVFDDGTGPALYAHGGFTQSGSVSLPNMAKWDGVSWSPPPAAMTAGAGVPDKVLGVFDLGAGPELYAADTDLPGVIRRWDGTAWVPLGAGVSGLSGAPYPPHISTATVFDDGTGPALYVGGAFDQAGNVQANGIAKWDGTSWSALGSGLGFGQNNNVSVDNIFTLKVHDDGSGPALIAGGVFQLVASNIMKWDGTSWSGLAGGLAKPIMALETYDDGTGPALYAAAGAPFSTARDNVGRWACSPSLVLGLSQTEAIAGGGDVYVSNENLIPGLEYYNIFSLDVCPGGPGTGPYGGLCFSTGNLSFLINQLALPLGSIPIHFTAPAGGTTTFGPYTMPPMTIEGLCVEISAGAINRLSEVTRFTIH